MHDVWPREQTPSRPSVKVTKPRSIQVIDQNATPRRFRHAAQQLLRIVVAKMVEKQRRHQYIVSLWQRLDERVESEKLRTRQLRLIGDTLRVLDRCRADIATMRLYRNAVSGGQRRNADHHVAAARRDVENSQRPAVIRNNPCSPDAAPNHLRRATDRIRRSQSVERVAVRVAIQSRLIHQFGLPISVCQELQFPLPGHVLQLS